MARLVLHIGTHKTGTTSIQDTCEENRMVLAKAGLNYPKLHRGHHGLLMDWVPLPKAYKLSGTPEIHWRNIADHVKGRDATVLISSEEFSRGEPGSSVDFDMLKSWTSEIDEIQIVCFVREQVSFLQSVFLEIARTRPTTPWPPFLPNALEHKFASGVFLDYGQLLDHLLQFFARDQIKFLSFADAVKHPKGPTGHLLDALGFGHVTDEIEPIRSNVSEAPLAYWLAHMIAKPRHPDPELLRLFADRIDTFPGGQKSLIFNRAEIRQIAETFGPLNAAFQERAPELPPDALKIDLEKIDQMVRRDKLAPWFWIDIMRKFSALKAE